MLLHVPAPLGAVLAVLAVAAVATVWQVTRSEAMARRR